MSYFDDASLVMIPSGYKTSKVYSVKPTDGSGDLTFSRSNDTATRVNSAGLIEKVRTNLILYSEQFDNGAYNKGTGGSISANSVVAPNGTTTADAYTFASSTGSFAYLSQFIAGTSQIPNTFSIYLKRPTGSGSRTLQLVISDYTLSSGYSSNFTVTESWQRFEFTRTSPNTTGYVGIGLGTGSSGVSIAAGEILHVWGAQLETGDIATSYIATTSAAVSVGPVANVPRLDYLNSSCPRLLLEPQRTNLLINSEQINLWASAGGSAVGNTVISPDGTQNADTLTGAVYQVPNVTGTYTFSLFAKKTSGNNFITLRFDTPATQLATFNLNTGVVTFVASGYSATITPYANGWYRCTFTTPPSTNVINTVIYPESGGTLSTYVWGAQLEAGAYATSYIPTLGAAVTRGSDAASKTSASALIGQTEGVVFIDFNRSYVTGSYDRFIVVDDNDASIYRTGIFILPEPDVNGRVYIEIRNNSTGVFGYTYNSTTVPRLKIAIAYKNNDMAIYVNGTQMATSTSALSFAHTLQRIAHYGNSEAINQTLLFKTRLSNSDLAALTA